MNDPVLTVLMDAYALLSDETNWSRRDHAETAAGTPCSEESESAVRYSLIGALGHVCKGNYVAADDAELLYRKMVDPTCGIRAWNATVSHKAMLDGLTFAMLARMQKGRAA